MIFITLTFSHWIVLIKGRMKAQSEHQQEDLFVEVTVLEQMTADSVDYGGGGGWKAKAGGLRMMMI